MQRAWSSVRGVFVHFWSRQWRSNTTRRNLKTSVSTMRVPEACQLGTHNGDEKFVTKEFMETMRAVPSPVIVVTTSDGHVQRGVTCSSFTSVSLKPPIISFCMQRPSRMHNLLMSTKKFAVNILSEKQVHYSVHFSQPVDDHDEQFSEIRHTISSYGVPVLPGCCAVLSCSAHGVHNVGDHYVWYGHVVNITRSTKETPLLYYARSYRSISDESFMRAFETATLAFEDWSHEAHLRMAWNYITECGRVEATPLIRAGIQKYNEKNKDKIERGYHETVTMFFVHMIDTAIQKFQGEPHTFEEFLKANPHLSKSAFLYQYYSQERLQSLDAKHTWVGPDLQPLPS